MAIESRRPFSPQFLANRQTINAMEANGNGCNAPMPPLSANYMKANLLPFYGSGVNDSVLGMTTAFKAVTYSLPVSRKRARDSSINPLHSHQNINPSHSNRCGTFTFLGEDISLQIQQQQMEIDRFIAQHTAKVRMEIENRRKRNSRRIIAAVEEGVMKRLRAKEVEIAKIGELNRALEEKAKSLSVENQIWREMAETNEATANALRANLEKVHEDQRCAMIEEAESCCGSTR